MTVICVLNNYTLEQFFILSTDYSYLIYAAELD